MQLIDKYFTRLSDLQRHQFEQLGPLYEEWNAKINVISRRDIGNLYEHHVLHSLAIAEAVRFKDGSRILDVGTGGGFPGIPLAIMFPQCQFKLIDGTGKKIRVVEAVSEALGLKNVIAEQLRAEDEHGKYDFVVTRAVMPLPQLMKIVRKNIAHECINATPNGVLALKGGDVKDEIEPFKKQAEVTPISTWFSEEWFSEKYVIYVPCYT